MHQFRGFNLILTLHNIDFLGFADFHMSLERLSIDEGLITDFAFESTVSIVILTVLHLIIRILKVIEHVRAFCFPIINS